LTEASTNPNIKCSDQLASFPPATSTYASIVSSSANHQLQNTIATVPDSEQLVSCQSFLTQTTSEVSANAVAPTNHTAILDAKIFIYFVTKIESCCV
jgi:hypothetical protein